MRLPNNYITDDNGELKPGDTISAQFNCGGEFDHIECYFDGRSDGTTGSAVQSDISDEDFDIKEYVVDSGFGSIQYLLVITNNSDKDVEISGNATALNSSGNVVGADDVDLDILGPGETSIGYFYFSNIGNDFDHIDYKLSYKTDSYYAPVISDLSAQASINESNVVVTVTNNGDAAADYVEAYVLFFDAENNITDVSSAYVTDDDGEIKPGATLSEQCNTYDPFDHVEIYFTGRRKK